MEKSSGHSKIIGDFGEYVICNWLSRSGFEVILVNHTGIDIIAYRRSANRRLGITVKSRTRTDPTENVSVNIIRKSKRDRKKILDACRDFACDPWIAIYVETEQHANFYLTSLKHYDKKYRSKGGKATAVWKMTARNRDQYEKDPHVKHVRMGFNTTNWIWK